MDASQLGSQPSPFKGFWIRVLATIIDGVLIAVALVAVGLVFAIFFGSLFGGEAGFSAGLIMFVLTAIAAQLLYKPLMESSEYQGTLGKHFLNIKVVDKHGRRITRTKSFIRTVVYLLHTIIPVIGWFTWLLFIMIAFTEEKQGLHDIAAETYVVSKYWQGPVPLQDNFGS